MNSFLEFYSITVRKAYHTDLRGEMYHHYNNSIPWWRGIQFDYGSQCAPISLKWGRLVLTARPIGM